MPLTRSAVLRGSSREETLLETLPLLFSSVKKHQAQILNLRHAASKSKQRICLEKNNTDIKNVLPREIRNHVDDDKPGPTCVGGDHQTAINQKSTVHPPNDPLIEVASMLLLSPLPMTTTVLPPPVTSTSVLPVTPVLSSFHRPEIVLPSHRIMVIVNGDLELFPLNFSMCRADTFTKLLCRISTMCSIDYGNIEPVSHAYTFEHNGFQVSSKDSPISLGYGTVAPSANVSLTFKITRLPA